MLRQSDNKLVRPDAKGRIYLGRVAHGISRYKMSIDCQSGEIRLKPYVEIPAYEHWVFDDPIVLHNIEKGIHQAQDTQLIKRKSFASHLNPDDQS